MGIFYTFERKTVCEIYRSSEVKMAKNRKVKNQTNYTNIKLKSKKVVSNQEKIDLLQDYRVKRDLPRLTVVELDRGYDYCKDLTDKQLAKKSNAKRRSRRSSKVIVEKEAYPLEDYNRLQDFRVACGLNKMIRKYDSYKECYLETKRDFLKEHYPKDFIAYFSLKFSSFAKVSDFQKGFEILTNAKYYHNIQKQMGSTYFTEYANQMKLQQLEYLRKIWGLNSLVKKQVNKGIKYCISYTVHQLKNAHYSHEFVKYIKNQFRVPIVELDEKVLISLMQTTEQQKTIQNKIYHKRIIVNGFVESIPIEVSDNLNIETMQYDYYNNDNNMYDNLDYRDIQDQFDLLGVTKNNWD